MAGIKRVILAAAGRTRRLMNAVLPTRSMSHLEAIRQAEIDLVLREWIPPPPLRVLELGAGGGWQARALTRAGYRVAAVDVAPWSEPEVFPVLPFDGVHLPFADGSFDLVFSSNVLEHVENPAGLLGDCRRVLGPSGTAVHLVPSASWRVWSIASELLRYCQPVAPHGEEAGNAFAEISVFRERSWRRFFYRLGWTVLRHGTNRLFYSGGSLLDRRVSLGVRARLSRVLGSSCHVFEVAPEASAGSARP